MLGERKTSDADVVRNDVTSNSARAVCDLERLAGIHEARGASFTEEDVVTLETNGQESRSVKGSRRKGTYAIGTLGGSGLATFGADPKVRGTGVHEKLEVARRGTHLDSGNVTNVVGSTKGCG